MNAAAVARGQWRLTEVDENTGHVIAWVPASIAELHERICFAREPLQSADCDYTDLGDEGLVPTPTSASLNSPVYYALVGWPSRLLGGDTGMYAMRFASLTLTAAAFGAIAGLLRILTTSRWALAALSLGTAPMVVYLSGSVNPNALEAVSAASALAAMITFARGAGRVRLNASIILVVSVALVLSARVVSFAWIALAILVTLVSEGAGRASGLWRRDAALWIALVGSVVSCAGAGLWHLSAPPGGEAEIPVPAEPLEAATEMIVHLPAYAKGYVGVFGWLDTSSPLFAYVLFGLAWAVVSVVAWHSAQERRHRVALVGLWLALLAGPSVIQAVLAPSVGIIWQGRYMLAVLLMLLVYAGLLITDDRVPAPHMVAVARGGLLIATALSHILVFVVVLRRYVVGYDDDFVDMLGSSEWQPPLGWMPLTAAVILTVAAATWPLLRKASTREPPAQ